MGGEGGLRPFFPLGQTKSPTDCSSVPPAPIAAAEAQQKKDEGKKEGKWRVLEIMSGGPFFFFVLFQFMAAINCREGRTRRGHLDYPDSG